MDIDIESYINAVKQNPELESSRVIYGDRYRTYNDACFARIINNPIGKEELITVVIRSTLSEDFITIWLNKVLGRIWNINTYFIAKSETYTIVLAVFELIDPSIWKETLTHLVYYTFVLCRLIDKEWCPSQKFIKENFHPEFIIDQMCNFTDYILAFLKSRLAEGTYIPGHFFHDPFGEFVYFLFRNKISIELDSIIYFLNSIAFTLQSRKHTAKALLNMVENTKKPHNYYSTGYTAISDALSKQYEELAKEI